MYFEKTSLGNKTQAELPQEGILFRPQFPSLGKSWISKKLRSPSIQLLKLTYVIKVVLVFLDFQLFY